MTGAQPFPVAEDNVESAENKMKPEWIRKASELGDGTSGPGGQIHWPISGMVWTGCGRVTFVMRPGEGYFLLPQCLATGGGASWEQHCRPGAETPYTISQLGRPSGTRRQSRVCCLSDSDLCTQRVRASFLRGRGAGQRLAEDDFGWTLSSRAGHELFIGNCVSSTSASSRGAGRGGQTHGIWGFSEKIEEGKSELLIRGYTQTTDKSMKPGDMSESKRKSYFIGQLA